MSNTGNNSGSGSGSSSGGYTFNVHSTTGTSTGGTIWITVGNGFTFSGDLSGEVVTSVSDKKKKDRDGCDCKKCKEFYPYAEPNQEDGTLICYACRHGY